jgi:hypothetical protein
MIEGGPGAAITVEVVDVENPSMPVDNADTRDYVIHIEVSNNSENVQTVRQISVEQLPGDYALQLDRTSRAFDEMIDSGKEHEFTVRLQGQPVRSIRAQSTNKVGFRVTVTLANGDSYFYAFEGPVQ